MSPWKVILATMVIFGCGVVTGALVMKSTQRHPRDKTPATGQHVKETKSQAPPWVLQRVEFQRKIEKQLDLTPEQKTRIDKIMRESQERTKPLWNQIAPQMRDELKKVHEQIRAELTSDQQKKFEDLLKAKGKAKADDSSPDDRRRRALTNAPQGLAPTNTP